MLWMRMLVLHLLTCWITKRPLRFDFFFFKWIVFSYTHYLLLMVVADKEEYCRCCSPQQQFQVLPGGESSHSQARWVITYLQQTIGLHWHLLPTFKVRQPVFNHLNRLFLTGRSSGSTPSTFLIVHLSLFYML